MQGGTSRYLLVWLLVCTRANIVYVNGDYILEVRTHSYNNPTNRCAGCRTGLNDAGCCDDFSVFECTGDLRCDNYFYYCLRTIFSSRFDNNCDNGRFSNSSEPDGETINFSQDVVLGLANPLPLNGLSDAWNGIQLFLEVFDNDTGGGLPDDLVDRFLINIFASVPVGVETTTSTYDGIFSFATIELSFRVVCATGFTGDSCQININDCVGVNCSGNGMCVDGIDSYQCICNTGFNGTQCEMNIDDCAGVTCSGNGRCADGINNFTCVCDPGFTGELCEINNDDCVGVNCSGNGLCADGINNFTCTCDLGFTGELCETNINDCVGVDCSGNGQCEDGLDSFVCVCDPGFTAELCSITISEGGSSRVSTNTEAIAGGVIGALVVLLLLVVLVIIVVVVIVRRQGTKEKQTYKPEHPLPGDNPVYDTASDPSNAIPITVSSSKNGEYVNTNWNTTIASPPDHAYDFQNPLYGSRNATDAKNPSSTNASTNVTTTIGSTEHDFENPIYGSGTYASPTAAIYAIPEEPGHYEYLSETGRNQQS